MYHPSTIVQGFPGRSTHGALGWSTVTLLSNNSQHILIDSGSFGMRSLIAGRLESLGLSPKDISILLITHTHWDHTVNYTLFPNAEIYIGRVDMEWALNQPNGDDNIAEFYIKELNNSKQLRLVENNDEILPGIVAHPVPGHTPGHLTFVVQNQENDLIFTGDAGKNRAEFLSGKVSQTMDEEASRRSLEYLWSLWRKKPGNILIPGHDLPMMLCNGEPQYLEQREAAIQAWISNDLMQLTTFSLE